LTLINILSTGNFTIWKTKIQYYSTLHTPINCKMVKKSTLTYCFGSASRSTKLINIDWTKKSKCVHYGIKIVKIQNSLLKGIICKKILCFCHCDSFESILLYWNLLYLKKSINVCKRDGRFNCNSFYLWSVAYIKTRPIYFKAMLLILLLCALLYIYEI